MKDFLKSWLEYAQTNPDAASSVSSLASYHNIDRRKAPRIFYPPYGDLAYLPQILVDSKPISIYDISVGGLGLMPNTSATSGGEIDIEIKWRNLPGFHLSVKSVASYKHSSHLEFQDLSPELEQRLEACLSPKLLGQRFQLIQLQNAPMECPYEEVWMNPDSETLFLRDGCGFLQMDGEEIHIEQGKGIFLKKNKRKTLIRDQDRIAQLIIYLWNFNRPTQKIAYLRDYTYSYWRMPTYV